MINIIQSSTRSNCLKLRTPFFSSLLNEEKKTMETIYYYYCKAQTHLNFKHKKLKNHKFNKQRQPSHDPTLVLWHLQSVDSPFSDLNLQNIEPHSEIQRGQEPVCPIQQLNYKGGSFKMPATSNQQRVNENTKTDYLF